MTPRGIARLLIVALCVFSGRVLLSESAKVHPETLSLQEGWTLQSSAKIKASGETISKPGFATTDWYPARVPSTVFGTLVNAGVYKDVFFDKNLDSISSEPFKTSWWYRTEFSLNGAGQDSFSRLLFEGVNFRANVWLNGRKIADKDSLWGRPDHGRHLDVLSSNLLGQPDLRNDAYGNTEPLARRVCTMPMATAQSRRHPGKANRMEDGFPSRPGRAGNPSY